MHPLNTMYNGRRFRSKRGRRTSVKNRRRITRSRPSARNQRRQILSNQNQIATIQKTLRETREQVSWRMGCINASLAGGYPLVVPLTSGPGTNTGKTAQLNNVGSTDVQWDCTMTGVLQNDMLNKSKCFLYKQYVDFVIESGTDATTQQYTIYLVSLRPDTAQLTYNETSNMTSLLPDRDFSVPPSDTTVGDFVHLGAYLNPRAYKIHHKWTCNTQSTADEGIASVARDSSNTTNQHNRFQCTVNYGGTTLASRGDTTSGSLDDTIANIDYADIPPHKKRFLIVFSDSNTQDDVNHSLFSMNSIISGATA